jgi:hypothetical protein
MPPTSKIRRRLRRLRMRIVRRTVIILAVLRPLALGIINTPYLDLSFRDPVIASF